MKVTVLRGLPGSGKSTWASKQNAVVCNADKFHVCNDGVYRYVPEAAHLAHMACFVEFLEHLSNNSDIIVDCTNTAAYEMAPYIRMAEVLDLEIEIIHMHCSIEASRERNDHGVPGEIIRKMANNLRDILPAQWIKYCKYNDTECPC